MVGRMKSVHRKSVITKWLNLSTWPLDLECKGEFCKLVIVYAVQMLENSPAHYIPLSTWIMCGGPNTKMMWSVKKVAVAVEVQFGSALSMTYLLKQ